MPAKSRSLRLTSRPEGRDGPHRLQARICNAGNSLARAGMKSAKASTAVGDAIGGSDE